MRQRVRKTILVISFLLFPITIWYFSPYLIIQAASEHIMNGSFIVFVAMLVLSMFFGRAWCGYLCPAGGLQECLFMCNPKPAKQGWRNKIKYVIWIIWIIAIIVTFVLGKNDVTIDPFYMTDHGISIADFMVIGSTLGRWLHLPQLHVEADKDACISCGQCNKSCPMGLDVKSMTSEGINEKCTECIQCGACIDACPKNVLKYKLRWR